MACKAFVQGVSRGVYEVVGRIADPQCWSGTLAKGGHDSNVLSSVGLLISACRVQLDLPCTHSEHSSRMILATCLHDMSPLHVSTAIFAACLRSMSSSTPFAALRYWLLHPDHIVHLPGYCLAHTRAGPFRSPFHSPALQSDSMILWDISLKRWAGPDSSSKSSQRVRGIFALPSSSTNPT